MNATSPLWTLVGVSFALGLLVGPVGARASGIYGGPVLLGDPRSREILLWMESTACFPSAPPVDLTGCRVTSSSPQAVFGLQLRPTLTAIGGVAEIRIPTATWDQVLKSSIHNPAGGILYTDGSASDYVLRIDPSSGEAVFANWSFRLTFHGEPVQIAARLLSGPGAEPYVGDIAQGPVLLVCGLNPGTPPDPGECDGSHFVPNEPYNPATGFLNHAGAASGLGDLELWVSFDLAMQEVPEATAQSRLLAAGVLAGCAAGWRKWTQR